MKIPDGVVVTLYKAAGFGGESKSFTGKVDTLEGFRAQASSLKAEFKRPQ